MTGGRLAEKLRRLIEADGPMSIAAYMAHCLGDPEHGYYATRDPFGASGDFVTAPEISQMFGEIVGAWLINAWRLCGGPSPVRLVELGPGRGTLMADILRVAAIAPDFLAAVTVHLVETSPVLKTRQAETLGRHASQWHAAFAEVPEGPLLLVANEFFDALPVMQFVRVAKAWRERVIGLAGHDELAFGIGPGSLQPGPAAPEGSVLELSPAAEALTGEIARRIAAQGGAALMLDYGYKRDGYGDTLQAVRAHGFVGPLDLPGESDLTAHVNFARLARAAEAEGASVHGPVTQGEFLLMLGLAERAGQLGANADAESRAALRHAVDRLAGPDAMGRLFKVMAVTRRGLAVPPFPARI